MMMWTVFVFFPIIIRVESRSLEETRIRVEPKISKIQTIITATDKIIKVNEENNHTFGEMAENVSKKNFKAIDFFLNFQNNVKQLKDTFDKVVYDYILRQLWNYCIRVLSLILNTDDLNDTDVKSIKFEETFDYCVVTYLVNSDQINDDIHPILSAIYYLQIFPYFSDTVNMKNNCNVFMRYLINMFKSYGNFNINEMNAINNKKYSKNELIEQLSKIRNYISTLSKEYCITMAPTIVNSNLVINQESFYSASKFVKSVVSYERIYLTYGILVNRTIMDQFKIREWTMHDTRLSVAFQADAYSDSVTLGIGHMKDQINYPKELESSNIQVLKHGDMMGSIESMNTLLQSLKIFRRSSYENAVQYYNIAAEVFMVVVTNLGKQVLRGIKGVFEIWCMSINREKFMKIPFTVEMVLFIRSQLLQFYFYFSKIIDTIKLKLRVNNHKSQEIIGEDPHSYPYYQKLFPIILNLINIKSSFDELKINCQEIGHKLGYLSDYEFGIYSNFNESKFKEYYFVNTTRNVFEIYDYFLLFVKYHYKYSETRKSQTTPNVRKFTRTGCIYI